MADESRLRFIGRSQSKHTPGGHCAGSRTLPAFAVASGNGVGAVLLFGQWNYQEVLYLDLLWFHLAWMYLLFHDLLLVLSHWIMCLYSLTI